MVEISVYEWGSAEGKGNKQRERWTNRKIDRVRKKARKGRGEGDGGGNGRNRKRRRRGRRGRREGGEKICHIGIP